MDVHFNKYDINNTTKEYIIEHIKKQYKVQDFQILMCDGSIMLTDKLGEIFAYIATYK